MFKIYILLLVVLQGCMAVAQDFKYESKINKVPHKAFYNIVLNAEITSNLNDNFGDIRIFDSQNNEIPYQLYTCDSIFNEVSKATFSQKDKKEDKYSLVKIKFEQAQYIDKMSIEVEKTGYFLREAEFIEEASKRKLKRWTYPLKAFQLSSNSENVICFDYKQHFSEIELKIINNDDKPLKIKAIKGFQRTTNLIAQLDSSNEYVLRFGSEKINSPVYDLKFFLDSLSKKRPSVNVQTIKNRSTNNKENKAQSFPKIIIWILLSVVLVFLGIMSYKIVKEKTP